VPQKGIGYGILRYLKNERFEQNPDITFNYLGDFGSNITTENGNALFEFIEDYHGKSVSPLLKRASSLEISGLVVSGCLTITISYSVEQFTKEKIKSLSAAFERSLRNLIDLLVMEKEVQLTPVDFTYKGLSMVELERLNSIK
jgi:non-ribosomal peptide synthase protein (TIGR01720 family)